MAKIKIKTGSLLINLPVLLEGEPAYVKDTGGLYIGHPTLGNILLNEVITGSGLSSISVDNSTIQLDSGTLKVKALGITNDQISASANIAESKLALNYSTSSLNTAINDKVAKAGDTMTGTLAMHLGADEAFRVWYGSGNNQSLTAGVNQANGNAWLGWGAIQSTLDTQKYDVDNFAVKMEGRSGDLRVFTAPSGTAGNTITWTERFRINNAGNVGVGVSPSSIFHTKVATTASNVLIQDTTDASGVSNYHAFWFNGAEKAYLGFGSAANTHFSISNNFNSDMYFRTNNTTRVTIKNTGFVGISTASPDTSLHVVGEVTLQNANGKAKIVTGTSGDISITANSSQVNGTPNIVWSTSVLGGSITEKMRLSGAGNLGIGTNNPDYLLTLSKSTYPAIHLIQGTNHAYFAINASTVEIERGASSAFNIKRGSTSNLYISTTDKVGIGTTSPVGKLTVFTGASGTTYDLVNQQNGSISFSNNAGAAAYPTITSKSNDGGLVIVSGTNDSFTDGDMVFSVRENDNTAFSTLTSKAFDFRHLSTSLVTILRNGDVTVTGSLKIGTRDISTLSIVTKTANYTVTDNDDVILVDASSNDVTITLLAVASRTLGRPVIVKRLDNTYTNTVTIDGNSTETIDGDETITIDVQYNSKTMVPSTNWHLI